MSANRTVDKHGTGRNWATMSQKKRRGNHIRGQREEQIQERRIECVDKLTSTGGELVDMVQRKWVDVLCVQETRWKTSKARNVEAGFKLYYHRVNRKRS